MSESLPQITKFASEIAARQYYKKDQDGLPVEDYVGMLRRVAKHAARAEAIDAYKADNGRYPEWYISFDGRKKNLLDLESLDTWITTQGYAELCATWEEKFYKLLVSQRFSPAGRILAGAGSTYGQLMNCFVLGSNGRYITAAKDDADSIDGIYELSYKLAKVTKTGGGCGISLNFMRESGSHVQGSGGTSSGPISFLRNTYNTTLRVIKLEGVRRGAGMATMRIHHPDVLDFITAKDPDREEIYGAIEAFNISLLITDEFMHKVKNNELMFFTSRITGKVVLPSPVSGKYHLPGTVPTATSDNPHDTTTSKEIPIQGLGVSAQWLWKEITDHAWQTGDPGILFIDKINDEWPFREALGEIEATNPCGEEPLWFGESCCLGSVVLDRYVFPDGGMDLELLTKEVPLMIRFLDNVLTINVHPIEDTQEWCDRLRRVGLGVMGDAITMMKLGLGYSSEDANEIRRELAETIRDASLVASEQLAVEKGPLPFVDNLPEGIRPRRNVHTLSIAPTGTISMVCDTSSGIEPIFALAMQRKVGQDYKFRLDPTFERYLHQFRPDINLEDETQFVTITPVVGTDARGNAIRQKSQVPQVIKDILNNHGSIYGLSQFERETNTRMFETAHDVLPLSHVAVQAHWQKYLSNDQMPMASISKTVNLPNDATIEMVREVYQLGFEMNLKGITIYRDGSRSSQVLRTDLEEEKEDTPKVIKNIPATIEVASPEGLIMHRPLKTSGDMTKASFRDANGKERKVYVYLGLDDIGYPLEVFITDEDGGYDVHPYAAALGKMISMALKHGATPHKLSKKLVKIEGGSVSFSGDIYQSVPAMIGKLLSAAVNDMEIYLENPSVLDKCEECTMIDQGACKVCVDCGYSRC